MLIALTLVGPDPGAAQSAVPEVAAAVAATGARVKEPRPLGPGAVDLMVEADAPLPVRDAALGVLAGVRVDACAQPWSGRRKRLLLADMDSTIIGCEGLDELADYAGVKAEVAAITETAMRGEIDFSAALRARVARLEGLPVEVLARCLAERVRLNPGARTLATTMAAAGARCVLVSGGFQTFSAPVAAQAGFQAHRANRLLDDGARLTGQVAEPILGRDAKLTALREEAASLGIEATAVLAVGDGANDLAMIEAAGLGVAYRAKPIVAARATARIDHADLTALLFFQGYTTAEFAQD